MDLVIVLAWALFLSVVAVVVAAIALHRSKRGPNLVGRTVVVHTKQPDDRTIRGVLHGAYTDRWTVRDAVAMYPGGHEQPLGGLEHIPVGNISFVQELPPSLAEAV